MNDRLADLESHLRDKFARVVSYGPQQVVAFYGEAGKEEREFRARRAYELVARFLEIAGG